jgi:hypothetical protein
LLPVHAHLPNDQKYQKPAIETDSQDSHDSKRNNNHHGRIGNKAVPVMAF